MDCKFCAMLFPHAHNFIVYKPVKMDVGLGGRLIIYITCFSTKREKDNKSETQSGTGSATLMICMHSNSTWIFSISDLSFIMPECSLKFCKGRKKLKRFPRDEVVREKWTLFCGRESSWWPGTGQGFVRLILNSAALPLWREFTWSHEQLQQLKVLSQSEPKICS